MKIFIATYFLITTPFLVQAETVVDSTIQYVDSIETIQRSKTFSNEEPDSTKRDIGVNDQNNPNFQQRKHISFLPVGCFLGRGKATSAFVGGWDFPVEFDLSRGTSALLNYGYSLTERWDIICDLRTWRSYDQGMRGYKFQQYNIYLTGIGIGFRYYIASVDRKVRPYIQGIINDQIENWHLIGFDISGSDLGIGGAVSVGTEIRINQFFSFPIEYFYLVGKKPKAFGFVESIESWQDTSSLSGQGISVGLSYNWPGKANKYINQVKGNTAREKYNKYHLTSHFYRLVNIKNDRSVFQEPSAEEERCINLRCGYSLKANYEITAYWNRSTTRQEDSIRTYSGDYLAQYSSTVVGMGAGIKYYIAKRITWLKPYIQGGLYWITVKNENFTGYDSLGHWTGLTQKGSGIGVGANLGLDIYINKYISIPLEVSYTTCTPKVVFGGHKEDLYITMNGTRIWLHTNINEAGYVDISVFEITTGISLHF
jgi:hypothetical protein